MAAFDKELTETDISTMLVIPTHFMNNLPAVDGGCSVNATVLDAFGTEKTFGYHIQNEGNRGQCSKVLVRLLCTGERVEVGNRILFECVEGFLRYKFHAQRTSLFGKEIWGDI